MTRLCNSLSPISPGEILYEEFIVPLGLTVEEMARKMEINRDLLGNIISGKAPITEEISLDLSKFTNTSPDLWMGLEIDYSMRKAKKEII